MLFKRENGYARNYSKNNDFFEKMFERETSIYKKFDGIIDDSPVTSQTPSDFIKPLFIFDTGGAESRVNLDDYIKLEKKIHDLQRFAEPKVGWYSRFLV